VDHDVARGVITVEPHAGVTTRVPTSYSGLNRIPILLLGPLLHRTGEAFVPMVGGDPIGRRPVDFHIAALGALGAQIEVTDEGLSAKATKLRGAKIELPYPSVGATETVLLTAALAEGRTVLRNAATEPEVIELALFLQRMGARIELSPGRKFTIDGVESLTGAQTTLAGDRNEAFSYLVAGLVTKGEVRVHGCQQDRLVTAITTLNRMGARFDITDDYIQASAPAGLRPAAVQTDTHPGFMTDWQTPLVVLFTQAEGMSVLHETVYEERLVYVPALKQMGAEIELFSTCLGGESCRFHDTNAVHSAVVKGVSKLRGARVEVPDVRAGFSSVIAAAIAEGPSEIGGIHHLERGYHRPAEQFAELGLSIDVVEA
jgi:UDP-N-acetylglucosamine 1-carboxyvinyltransferase